MHTLQPVHKVELRGRRVLSATCTLLMLLLPIKDLLLQLLLLLLLLQLLLAAHCWDMTHAADVVRILASRTRAASSSS
jgi:hypothetical protein